VMVGVGTFYWVIYIFILFSFPHTWSIWVLFTTSLAFADGVTFLSFSFVRGYLVLWFRDGRIFVSKHCSG
jgi:hypothetical protein